MKTSRSQIRVVGSGHLTKRDWILSQIGWLKKRLDSQPGRLAQKENGFCSKRGILCQVGWAETLDSQRSDGWKEVGFSVRSSSSKEIGLLEERFSARSGWLKIWFTARSTESGFRIDNRPNNITFLSGVGTFFLDFELFFNYRFNSPLKKETWLLAKKGSKNVLFRNHFERSYLS